jgi:CheY-like chemotaxis protein
MKKKILIIEDDEQISEIYKAELFFGGLQTILAASGKEGIEVVQSEQPDLILLDILMPNMDGVETLKHIRNLPNGKSVPVLVITNVGKNERIKDFAGLNIAGYIVKSDITPVQLYDKISEVLEQVNS